MSDLSPPSVPAPYGETDLNAEMEEMRDEMEETEKQQKQQQAKEFDGILDKAAENLENNERNLRDDSHRHKDMKNTLQELQSHISDLLQ